MYLKCKFQVAPIVIGFLGYVPKYLIIYLRMTGFNENELKLLIFRLEIKSVSVTVKICKIFLNFNGSFNGILMILILPNFYAKLHFKFSFGIKL